MRYQIAKRRTMPFGLHAFFVCQVSFEIESINTNGNENVLHLMRDINSIKVFFLGWCERQKRDEEKNNLTKKKNFLRIVCLLFVICVFSCGIKKKKNNIMSDTAEALFKKHLKQTLNIRLNLFCCIFAQTINCPQLDKNKIYLPRSWHVSKNATESNKEKKGNEQ